jgi:phenylacetate-CoA ligase
MASGGADGAAIVAAASLSVDELHAQTSRRLAARLAVLRRDVPAYAGLAMPGERALRVDALALTSLPLLRRDDVRRLGDALVPTRTPRILLRSVRTSGASGEPLTLRRDLFSALRERAFLGRHFAMFGVRAAPRTLRVRRDGPHDGTVGFDVLDGEFRVRADRLDDRAVRGVVTALSAHRIEVLRGYPSALAELVRRARLLGIEPRLRSPWLRLVHVSSETLLPAARATLAEAFAVPVANLYGQSERVLQAFTCAGSGWHLAIDYGWGEVIDSVWVGTPLAGSGTALLRYVTGDLAGPTSSCGCALPFPTIGPPSGRADDLVVTTDGRHIGRLGPAIAAIDALAVQIEQLEPDLLRLRLLVPPHAEFPVVGAAAAKHVAALIADERMRIETVEEPPRVTAAGKRPAVIGLPASQPSR